VKEAREKFIEVMDDDFNCREAVAVLYDFGRRMNEILNKTTPSRAAVQEAYDFFNETGGVLGLLEDDEEGILDEEIEAKIKEREEARSARDFARADAIRDKLAAMGIILEDTKEGVRWRRA
jgi:cysteinyl-tRNA synthetase